MNFVKKMGLKFFAYIFIMAFMFILGIYLFFINKSINLYTFLFVMIGCIGFIATNFIDRKKDLVIEEHDLLKKAEEQVQLGEWHTAVEFFDRILVLNPKSLKAMMGRAYCLKERADYDHAIDQYDQVIGLKGGFCTIYYLKGVCYFRSRKFKEAKEAFDKAVELKPDFIEPYLLLGDLYYTINNDAKAQKCYEEYMKRCENDMLKALAREKIESLKNRKIKLNLEKAREEAIARGEQVQDIETLAESDIAGVDSSKILEALMNQMAKVERVEDFSASRLSKNDIVRALQGGLNEKEKAEILRLLQADVGKTTQAPSIPVEETVSREEKDELLGLMRSAESGLLEQDAAVHTDENPAGEQHKESGDTGESPQTGEDEEALAEK